MSGPQPLPSISNLLTRPKFGHVHLYQGIIHCCGGFPPQGTWHPSKLSPAGPKRLCPALACTKFPADFQMAVNVLTSHITISQLPVEAAHQSIVSVISIILSFGISPRKLHCSHNLLATCGDQTAALQVNI